MGRRCSTMCRGGCGESPRHFVALPPLGKGGKRELVKGKRELVKAFFNFLIYVIAYLRKILIYGIVWDSDD